MNLLLGTMTFGEQLFDDDVKMIVSEFLSYGYNELDTAYVYNDGKSEQLIGKAIKEFKREKIKIDSKVNPRITGKLDEAAVRVQLEETLLRLNTDYVDTYYLHFPDKNSPIEPVLQTIDEYYKKGRIRRFGISNFPAEMVRTVYNKCVCNSWLKPTVYEGLYNPLSRKIEKEMDECLQELGICLNIYNPLAGGLLTDRYTNFSNAPSTGRFTLRPNYQSRYWKKTYFEAIDMLKKICGKYSIGITEATMRWLTHSSILNSDRGDGIIIGVSKMQHLIQNIKYAQGDVLPEEVIEAFDLAWTICRNEAPEYYRFYGGTV